jgi:hypothetical protein
MNAELTHPLVAIHPIIQRSTNHLLCVISEEQTSVDPDIISMNEYKINQFR